MEGKSVGWKLAIAAELKRRSNATDRWLAETMKMGNLHEVSRKVAAWQREPDERMPSLLAQTPRPVPAGWPRPDRGQGPMAGVLDFFAAHVFAGKRGG